jgi:hypothetical protein
MIWKTADKSSEHRFMRWPPEKRKIPIALTALAVKKGYRAFLFLCILHFKNFQLGQFWTILDAETDVGPHAKYSYALLLQDQTHLDRTHTI